jgi:hypothetical protein
VVEGFGIPLGTGEETVEKLIGAVSEIAVDRESRLGLGY